jgi:threonylcarbamoyladenosine tRNA methylthiotransferase MtaB
MPQVSARIARQRAALLRAAGERQFAKLCASRVGRVEQVLIERNGMGRTEQFVPIMVPGTQPGDVLDVLVTGVTREGLAGEAVREVA